MHMHLKTITRVTTLIHPYLTIQTSQTAAITVLHYNGCSRRILNIIYYYTMMLGSKTPDFDA